MLCPHCQSEIAQESKFCPECGTRISGMSSISQGGSGLMRPCPECGRENRISLTICDGCGSDVNTFLAVQDAAQKMRAYAAEKKWIPLEKEYGLLPESPRLPGEKGQNLLAEVTTLHDVVRELEACSTLVYEAKAKKDWPAVVTEADKALVQDADNAEAKTLREEAKSHLPRVPEGFRLAPGAGPEPYTDTGWAAAIIHEKSGIELVYIPAGTFTMGSPDDEGDKDCIDETALPFRVTLFEGFYLGKYEVTQAQWEKVMKKNPSGFQNAGPNAPVENVNWDDCQAFCKAAGSGLRLPMEVEWEYACRAGTKTVFHYGNSLNASKVLATVKNGVILAVWSGGREALDAGDRLPSARRLQGA